MAFSLGKIAQNIRTNMQGMRDPQGAASRFSKMAQEAKNPADAAKYQNLADQYQGITMQGGFGMALMSGGLGVPASAIQMQAMQEQMGMGMEGGFDGGFAGGSPFLNTNSTAALSGMYGRV